jgi:hypothetical protein
MNLVYPQKITNLHSLFWFVGSTTTTRNVSLSSLIKFIYVILELFLHFRDFRHKINNVNA